MTIRRFVMVILFCFAGAASNDAAEVKVVPTTVTGGDQFGISVALGGMLLDGDRALVGAPRDTLGGADRVGMVYYLSKGVSGWTVSGASAADPSIRHADDWYGRAVSLYGDKAVIGAPFFDASPTEVDSGNGWMCQIPWTCGDPLSPSTHEGASLGYSVAVSGSYALIGVPYYDGLANATGAVHVYHTDGSTWAYDTTLTASDGERNDFFGQAVAGYVSRAVIGAPNGGDGPPTGAVYVFEVSGGVWSEVAKLTASDAALSDYLGSSVAVSGSYVAAGAPYRAGDQGAVYVYSVDGSVWSEEARLTASDGAVPRQLGYSVALFDPYLVVGAPKDDSNGEDSGAVYLFRRQGSTWSEVGKRVASDGVAYERFGFAVSIWGSDIAVGAPYSFNSEGDYAAGAIYFFEINDIKGFIFADGFERGDHSRWSAASP